MLAQDKIKLIRLIKMLSAESYENGLDNDSGDCEREKELLARITKIIDDIEEVQYV